MKRSPMKRWRRPKADQVTEDLVEYLKTRDGERCMAVVLEWEDGRRSGSVLDIGQCRGRLTVEHVRHQAAMGGKRAPSDGAHTLLVCEGHIEWTKLARSKRLERHYLSVKEGSGED